MQWFRFLLPAFSVSKCHRHVSEELSSISIFGKIRFQNHKKWIAASFYHYQIHTHTHIYNLFFFDLIWLNHNPLFLLLFSLLSDWFFPKDPLFAKCHSDAAWCTESFMRVVPFSTLVTYSCVHKIAETMTESASLAVKHLIIVFVRSLNFLGYVQGFCLHVGIYKAGKAWLFTCLLTENYHPHQFLFRSSVSCKAS